MSDVVHWVVEFDIKAGQLETLKPLVSEMVEATKTNEPDTLIYEFFITGDGKHLHIYERYADCAAVLTHLKTFGERFAERLFAMVDFQRVVVYGNPDNEVQAALAPFEPTYMGPLSGFAR
jgi:quinol monooxygenase YgiN